MKRSSFRMKVVRRVARVDSREDEAIRGPPGEENEEVELKCSRRGGTDAVFQQMSPD